MKLKDALSGTLDDDEIKLVPRAFDVVGDIAIIEIPEELSCRKKLIAEKLVQLNPRLKTVCNKTGERHGEYRLPDLEVIYGNETETEHVESGCRFRTDVVKTYFSPREATERQRIGKMLKPGENILVMFSGVGPSQVTMAKIQPRIQKAYGVDVNPEAHRYALENIRINRVPLKAASICGDVRKVVPEMGIKFHRITMPLPKGAHEFLDVALGAVRDGGTVHFYHYDREDDLFTNALDIVREECRKAGKRCEIIDKRKVLPYGPRIWKICVDFRVFTE